MQLRTRLARRKTLETSRTALCLALALGMNQAVIAQSNEGILIASDTLGIKDIKAADLDNDNDLDLVAVFYDHDTVGWYENLGPEGQFGPLQIISDIIDGGWAVDTADLNGDFRIDVVVAHGTPELYQFSKIQWFENVVGPLGFAGRVELSNDVSVPMDVHAAHINSDDFIDIVTVSTYDAKVVWHSNSSGDATFDDPLEVGDSLGLPVAVETADLDGDGDTDVVTVVGFANEISWFENLDGEGSFGDQTIVATQEQSNSTTAAMALADLDGDEDVDVISGSFTTGQIIWYANNGAGEFSIADTVYSQADEIVALVAQDLDFDGSPDLVSGAATGRVTVWGNSDGNGVFSEAAVLSADMDSVVAMLVADMDDNGNPEVIVASRDGDTDLIRWLDFVFLPIAVEDGPAAVKSNVNVYPSPASNSLTFSFEVPISGTTSLDVFDVLGRSVGVHWAGVAAVGSNAIHMNVSGLASGTYFYTIRSATMVSSGQFSVVR